MSSPMPSLIALVATWAVEADYFATLFAHGSGADYPMAGLEQLQK